MILVTGASGNAGGAVLQAARARNLPVRAMYRSEADARAATHDTPKVVADFADAPSLQRALDGITTVFIVCAPVPQLIELESAMIDACKSAGVRHVVLNSALGAGRFPKSFPSWHTRVEELLKASGLAWTILRPNGFMQNIATYNAATIRAQHAFYASLGDAKVSLVDVRDVGEAAAAILADPQGHAGKTYELNGPEALANAEIAERLSRILGTKITYVDIPEDAQRQSMLQAGMPEWQVSAVLELQQYYRSGACADIDTILPGLTGKPARTLDAYLAENTTAFRSTAA